MSAPDAAYLASPQGVWPPPSSRLRAVWDRLGLPTVRRLSGDLVLSRCLACLCFVGAGVGSLNLWVDGVLSPGWPSLMYAATMTVCVLLGALMFVRPSLVRDRALLVVLTGDLVYLVVVLSVVDAERFATPLMLLFTTVAAAWLLRPRAMVVHLVAVYPLCWVALSPTIQDRGALVVQVTVQGSVLVAAALFVQVLRRRLEAQITAIHDAATTDHLTGLANRRALDERVGALWARARREDALVAACVLDLDRFKEVNDVHGHAVGDRVLKAVAAAVLETVRGEDLVARTGGEEIVVLSLVEHPRQAKALADRLRAAVAGADGPVPVTTSVGVATRDGWLGADPITESWRLIHRADGAMYRAKTDGRDRVVLALEPETVPRQVDLDVAAATDDGPPQELGPQTVPGLEPPART